MTDGLVTLVVALVTAFACGAWAGWFAGRRHEKGLQALKRARPRRTFTISVDYAFAAEAFRRSGYEIVPTKERRVH